MKRVSMRLQLFLSLAVITPLWIGCRSVESPDSMNQAEVADIIETFLDDSDRTDTDKDNQVKDLVDLDIVPADVVDTDITVGLDWISFKMTRWSYSSGKEMSWYLDRSSRMMTTANGDITTQPRIISDVVFDPLDNKLATPVFQQKMHEGFGCTGMIADVWVRFSMQLTGETLEQMVTSCVSMTATITMLQ